MTEDKWRRSYRMLGIAWRLIWRTPAMRLVALVSFVAWLMSVAILFGPVVALWIETESRLALVAGGAVAAYPFTFITVYFQVALLTAANACMDGERLTVGESFAIANRRLRQIAGWSLLAAGVGAILDAIGAWVPWVGGIVSWLLGAAWSIATLFAVPVIVLEGLNGRGAARRSAAVFRRRWGESLIGVVSVTAFTMLATIPGGILICGGAVANASTAAYVAVAVGALVVAVGVFLGRIVEELFALALYRFAMEHRPQGGFTAEDLTRGLELRPAKRRR